jgi:PAS domain S-box-containing protein
MEFNFPWYSLIYLAGAVLTLALAIIVRGRQFAPGVTPFSYLLFSLTVWTLAIALEIGAVEIPAKILFAKIEYFALVNTGALSLLFILEYTHSRVLRGRKIILLWIVPVLSLAMAWTNELHGLVWSNIYLNADMNGTISVWEHGPLYLVTPLYQYLLLFAGIIILFRNGLHRPRVYRRQVYWLLAGSLVPVAGSIVYVAGGNIIKGFDITPVTICIMGVVFAITILRFKFLDILPTATAAFVKNLPDGFLLLDAEGQVVSLNPATEKIMGQTKSLITGQRLSKVWPELDKIIIDKHSGQHIELIIDKPGEKAYLDISIESFMDRYQSLMSKMIIIRNVTELKLTQLKLETEIKKRSQFTRAIVHELRNPLTAIISSSGELEDHVQLDEKMRLALVQNICRASIDLEHRVNELFELARGELGLLEINPELVDMNRLIHEIGAEMEPIAYKKGIKLTCKTAEAGFQVWGDKKRLRQVLSNLLSNAIKYTNQGQITIRSSQWENNFLLTRVEDSGRGIEKEELVNLFDSYLRSPREKMRSGGLGIGLTLSKRFIELHKGKIWVESTPGKGTTVSFIVPLYQMNKANRQPPGQIDLIGGENLGFPL